MENPAFEQDAGGEKPKNGATSERVYAFEEAVSLTGTGKYHYFLLLVCGFCFMAVMVETMGISIIMPFMKCDLEATVGEQGILASAGFLGVVLSSHIMGFLADTWGRVKTLRAALICSFIATVISAFSVNISMLIVFRFFNGFFISGCQACVFSFMGEFHGRSTRVRYVTLLSMFLPFGLTFLPGVAIGILPLKLDAVVLGIKFTQWRLVILANCLFSLVALCGLWLTPESPKYVLIQGRHEAALKILRMLFARNTGRPKSEYPVKAVAIDISGASLNSIHGVKDAFNLVWSQTVPLFYRERVWHTLNICLIMSVIFCIAQGTFMWFPTMLDQLVADQDQGYLFCETMYKLGDVSSNSTVSADSCDVVINNFMFEVLIIIGLAFTLLYIFFAFIIDIVGKKNILMIWLVIAALSCLALHWVSSFVASVILVTLTIGVANCGGILSTISLEFYPTNISAMAMCLIMMIGRLGAVVGSNIFGIALRNNCDLLYYVCVGVLGVVACLALLLPDKDGGKKTKIAHQNVDEAFDSSLSKGTYHKQQPVA